MSIGRTMPIRRMVLTMWRFRLRAMAGSLYKTSGVIDKPRRFARSSAGQLLQGEQNGQTVSLLRARGPRTLDLVLGRVGLVSSAGQDQGAEVQEGWRWAGRALEQNGFPGDRSESPCR